MKKIKEKKWGWSLQMITLNQGNIIYQVWPIWVAFAWKLYLTWDVSKLIHMLIRSIKLWFNWIIKEVIFDPCMCAQACLTLCNFTDCNPPDSSILGIFQARILEWVALSYSRGSSLWPWDGTYIICISLSGRWILYHCIAWEALFFDLGFNKYD